MNLDLGIQSLIAGAVFDFAAHLTTLPRTVRVGAKEPVYDVLAELERWAFQRNLDIEEADVVGWSKAASVTTLEDIVSMPVRRRLAGALRSYADFVVASGSSDYENTLVRWASSCRLAIHDPQRAWSTTDWWG